MKKLIGIVVVMIIFLTSCEPKAYYRTSKGKKKQKYYNEIQFNNKSAATMKQRR